MDYALLITSSEINYLLGYNGFFDGEPRESLGGLFAFGGLAVAPVSVGGLAIRARRGGGHLVPAHRDRRHAGHVEAAPAVVTALISGGLVVVPLSLWGLLPAAGYAVAAITAAAMIDRRSPLRTAAVLATMHLSWGAGFLTARPARLLGRGAGR